MFKELDFHITVICELCLRLQLTAQCTTTHYLEWVACRAAATLYQVLYVPLLVVIALVAEDPATMGGKLPLGIWAMPPHLLAVGSFVR